MSLPLITFDFDGSLLDDGITAVDLEGIHPHLEQIRDALYERDLAEFHAGAEVSQKRQPLDAGFMDMPDRLLAEYDNDRQGSELGRILATAKRIRESVDRVVVMGIGGSFMGARALMDACCEPYYNQLTRADRGGRPRVYFEGNNVDNDAMQGLLHLLKQEDSSETGHGRWAIVVISKSGGTIETAVALRQFLAAMEEAFGKDSLPELVVPVTGPSGKLADLAEAIGCHDRFLVPEGVGGRFSVFSPVGLLPASILGLDIMALLRGAWLMNGHFQAAPAAENVVLNYVGVNHLLETLRNIDVRVLSVWSKSLETLGLWYDQLFAESIGKLEQGATPLTVVNTRDLHSRAQQHQEGMRNKVVNNVVVASPRCDELTVGTRDGDYDKLNELAEKSLPDLMNAAISGTNQAYHSDGRPTTTITLPQTSEHAMGQLMQMLMLATVTEGRLLDINPYGQPGVELYKQNMNRILRS
ncbi:MAG: glucose-6-phosphate isomerase [Pirellulaceae bacterium]